MTSEKKISRAADSGSAQKATSTGIPVYAE